MGLLLLNSPFSPDPLYVMNPSQAVQIVLARWLSEWGSLTPVRLDNEVLAPGNFAEGTAWVSLTLEPVLPARQHTLGGRGNRQFERQMLLFAEIHTPTNAGTALSTTLVSTVLTMFEGWRDGGIMTREINAPRQGNTGRDYVVVVEISFTYYEQK